MIRVLQVVTHMNRGGLETMIMNYYRNIDRDQVQFDFLVHRQERAEYDDEIEKLGGVIYRISKLNPFSWKYKKELEIFFKSHPEYKVIHVHQDCMSSLILKVAQKCGIKVRIAHSHSASQTKNIKFIIKKHYQKRIPKYATKMLACGEEAGKWMFQGAEFEVLNNAIDASAYRVDANIRNKMREQLGISKDTFLVGHVGNFTVPKNHLFLIDVFRQVRTKTDAKLLLVGDGSLRTEIEAKIEHEHLKDDVILAGVRKDVPALLQAIDVFVFPSTYEGLPVTLIEAQAAGLPCLISNKVSFECKKTDFVQQVSLDDSVTVWAEKVINAKTTEKKDTYEEIKSSGYDIQENAKMLQQFYLRAAKGEKNLCLY